MFSLMYSHFHTNSFSHVSKILVIMSGIIKINKKKKKKRSLFCLFLSGHFTQVFQYACLKNFMQM